MKWNRHRIFTNKKYKKNLTQLHNRRDIIKLPHFNGWPPWQNVRSSPVLSSPLQSYPVLSSPLQSSPVHSTLHTIRFFTIRAKLKILEGVVDITTGQQKEQSVIYYEIPLGPCKGDVEHVSLILTHHVDSRPLVHLFEDSDNLLLGYSFLQDGRHW